MGSLGVLKQGPIGSTTTSDHTDIFGHSRNPALQSSFGKLPDTVLHIPGPGSARGSKPLRRPGCVFGFFVVLHKHTNIIDLAKGLPQYIARPNQPEIDGVVAMFHSLSVGAAKFN